MNITYKIECKQTLELIDAFFEKRSQFYDQVKKLCDTYNFSYYRSEDSIFFGIEFYNMVIDAEFAAEIDKTLWKTQKNTKAGYLNVLPRATAKKHMEEYKAMLPKKMDYQELNRIILADGVRTDFNRTYGYRYKAGEYFMFETSLPVSIKAVEILVSEYNKGALK